MITVDYVTILCYNNEQQFTVRIKNNDHIFSGCSDDCSYVVYRKRNGHI